MRVLHIAIDTAMGGIESFQLNVYRRIDRDKIQFDFIEYGEQVRNFDFKYLELGAKIYKLPDRKKHPFSSAKKLREIIETGNYEVVHIHKNSLCDTNPIKICRELRVPVIIVHSHNSSRNSKMITLIHKLKRNFMDWDDIYKFACSKKAADWLYGTNKKVICINNGIDTKRFDFNYEKRRNIREKFRCEKEFVIGIVGRIDEQKNPLFIIDLIHGLRVISKEYKLLWIGDGPLRTIVEKQIKKYHEEDGAIFLGVVDNPEDYYQAMDVFVMASIYEGFPIAAVEAQSSGLPCVLSNRITPEVGLTENVYWEDIDSISSWIQTIIKIKEKNNCRKSNQALLYEKGFDINSTVMFLQSFYENMGKQGRIINAWESKQETK